MAITKKQGMAMSVIVVAGLLAGGALLAGRGKTPAEGDAPEKSQTAQATAKSGEKPGSEAHGERGHDHQAAEGKPTPAAAKDEHGHAGQEGGKDEREERRVKLSAQQTQKAGIAVQAAGPAQLQAAAEFPGEVRFNEDRTAHIVPRVAGVAEQVLVNLGQAVRKGQVLAVFASTSVSEQRSELLSAQRRRESARVTYEREKKLWQDKISAEQDYLAAQSALQEADIAVQNASQKLAAVGANGSTAGLNRFEIRAPFDGIVVEKHLSLGEAVKEDASIFMLSDLRSVWAEFNVAPKDLGTVRVGQRVMVSSTAFQSKAEGNISYVGALLGEQTRTARARVTLTNPDGAWRPGLFVTVSVFGENQDVALTVPAGALQTIDNQPMVFKAVEEGFEAVPVKPGRSDGRTVEILGGLKAGDRVAARNSFVLKSELGKAEAGHGH